jgi:hypothetical protein
MELVEKYADALQMGVWPDLKRAKSTDIAPVIPRRRAEQPEAQ